MTVATRPAAHRDPGPLLWSLTGAAWLAMLALMILPAGMASMPAMAAAGLAGGPPLSAVPWLLAAFAGGWTVMVVAMMLPTTVPMARLFLVLTSDVPARRRVVGAFAGAYLAVWLAAGALGLGAAALVVRGTTGLPAGALLAGALALAGIVQLSGLTRRCLARCRDPRAFLFAHYRRGVGASWSLGVRHALLCLGCCWALMGVMFAVGSGGPLWMLGLTVVMVAEKTVSWGRRLVVPVGVVLLLAAAAVGVVCLLSPAISAPMPMPM